jgi:preprotein translocase subunit YajC
MNSILMFLDQAATTGDAGAGTSGSLLATLIPFALVIVVFYFFLIRPQKKQEKEAAKMRDSLQVGDEVTTIGGVIGRVVSIKDETFTLETSRDRTKIRFLRSAIKSVDVKVADLRAAEAAEEKPAEAVEEKPAKKAKKDAE